MARRKMVPMDAVRLIHGALPFPQQYRVHVQYLSIFFMASSRDEGLGWMIMSGNASSNVDPLKKGFPGINWLVLLACTELAVSKLLCTAMKCTPAASAQATSVK